MTIMIYDDPAIIYELPADPTEESNSRYDGDAASLASQARHIECFSGEARRRRYSMQVRMLRTGKAWLMATKRCAQCLHGDGPGAIWQLPYLHGTPISSRTRADDWLFKRHPNDSLVPSMCFCVCFCVFDPQTGTVVAERGRVRARERRDYHLAHEKRSQWRSSGQFGKCVQSRGGIAWLL